MTTKNLMEAVKLAAAIPGLLLDADKVAQSFRRGAHGRRRAGQGESFWQFRPYVAGDASRDVDWRQTAKRDAVFIREKEWEAAQAIWLYRDASASMRFSSSKKHPQKFDYAEILLLALSLAMLESGERVGLLNTSLKAQSGHAAVAQLAARLPEQRFLGEGARALAAQSHVAIISDFYFPFEELAVFCESLAARHIRGTLVQIVDPAEKDLPYDGRVRFQDIESAVERTHDIAEVGSIRALYQQKFLAHQEKIKNISASLGWRFEAVVTDVPPQETLARLYHAMRGM